MLATLPPYLTCVVCRDPAASLVCCALTDAGHGHIRDGILKCDRCGAWYPIADGILELLPPELFYPKDMAAFEAQHADRLKSLGCRSNVAAASSGRTQFDDQLKQRRHFDDYAEGARPDFVDFPNTPFWRAAAHRFLGLWRKAMVKPDAWILDIGCGIGVNSLPLADTHTVIGFDISKKAVARVTDDAERLGVAGRTTFFVADGTRLPARDASFEYIQTIGALHHLPDPQAAIREIVRVLRPGGLYYGVENNKSIFRGIFDLMMKIRPLWIEEAGAEPLISELMIQTWLAGLPAVVTSETSVFLPPHLFNLLGLAAAQPLLDIVDRLCLCIPGLRNQGGQILFTVRKDADGAAITPNPAGSALVLASG